MKRISVFGAVLAVAAATLVACGSGDTVPVQVAASNFSVNAGASTTAPLTGLTLTAPTGIPALGTSAATTMAITGTAGAQVATISEGALRAVTRLTFGSCIFTVTESNFPANSALGLGKTVTVNPCTVDVPTTGLVADAGPSNRVITLNMGGRAISTPPIPVTVSNNGTVVVNGGSLGSITLRPVTGG